MSDEKVYHIDEFVNICGYFNMDNPEINNGYNCSNSKCEEKENGIGKCFAWACPLGIEVDEEDFKKYKMDSDYDFEEGTFILHQTLNKVISNE